MTEAQAAARFAALADPTRLAVLRHLVRAGPAGAGAGAVARAVGAAPSRASFHLAALREAGLVSSRRDGRAVIYAADLDGLGGLLGWLIEECCAGAPALRDCCR